MKKEEKNELEFWGVLKLTDGRKFSGLIKEIKVFGITMLSLKTLITKEFSETHYFAGLAIYSIIETAKEKEILNDGNGSENDEFDILKINPFAPINQEILKKIGINEQTQTIPNLPAE